MDILVDNIRITSPKDGAVTSSTQISISVRWSEPEIDTVSCQGYIYNVRGDEQSHTFYAISLFEGWNTIWVHASGSGISESDSVRVYCDPHPPNLSIIGPTNNSEVSSSKVTIHGTISENYALKGLYYKGDQGYYGSLSFSGGQWNIFVGDLKNNETYTFRVVAIDQAGWTVQKTVSFTCRF